MPPLIENVARHLQVDADRLLEPAVDGIFRELTSYKGIPKVDLTASVQTNFRRAIETLLEGAAPTNEHVGEHRETTLQRIDQGIPIEDIIRAYRLSLRAIHARYIEICKELELSHSEALRGASLLWELGDWFVAGAAAKYRYRAGNEAVRRSLARAELLRELLLGNNHDPSNRDRLRDFGVRTDQRHAALITVPTPVAERRQVHLPESPAFTAQIGQRIIGLVQQGVDLRADHSPIALGPPQPLDNISYSAAIAERIWHKARYLPPTIYRLEDFGWRLAVSTEPTINQSLIKKYIEPVVPETDNGKEVIKTLTALLDNNMNIRASSQHLILHQNTLRYRIESYRKLSGVDLTSIHKQFELAWALGLTGRALLMSRSETFINLDSKFQNFISGMQIGQLGRIVRHQSLAVVDLAGRSKSDESSK